VLPALLTATEKSFLALSEAPWKEMRSKAWRRKLPESALLLI
jgi:hypothetical protein